MQSVDKKARTDLRPQRAVLIIEKEIGDIEKIPFPQKISGMRQLAVTENAICRALHLDHIPIAPARQADRVVLDVFTLEHDVVARRKANADAPRTSQVNPPRIVPALVKIDPELQGKYRDIRFLVFDCQRVAMPQRFC